MKGKYLKRDVINLAVLSAIYIFVIVSLVGLKNVYGSSLDWDNQHWIIPEYFRTRFYETGQFFPSFAFEAGAGQNIYYFAYYGLHSPFLYLSYLLPFIDMKSYIIGINILSVFASVWLFYIWLRGKYGSKVSFLTSALFLTASPLIFHSHRHIMFVDYMPFLLLTLIFVRRYFKKKGGICPIIISSLMLVTTSFFFSVGSFIVIGIYAIMQYLEEADKVKPGQCIKRIAPVVGAVIVAIAMSAILLIPTAMGLTSGRDSAEVSGTDWSILIPQVRPDFILYSTYSMGLSAFSVYALVAAAVRKNKARRFLAVIVAVICLFPVVVYMFNGGQYLDGKVLIPFLPLALLTAAEFFKSIFLKEKHIKPVLVIGTLINVGFLFTNLESYGKMALAAETAIIVVCFLIYYKKLFSYIVCIPVLVVSVLTCLTVNSDDNMPKHNAHEETLNCAVEELVSQALEGEESVYRFSNGYDKWRTVNKVVQSGYYQTTIYSSAGNKYYRDFYMNQIENEISYRNTALTTSGNVLFNIYMGVKYYMSESAYIPAGYSQMGQVSDVYLYESDDVYPVGYSIHSVISSENYNKLNYPYSAEALMKYAVVDKDVCDIDQSDTIETGIQEYKPDYSVRGDDKALEKTDYGYRVNAEKNFELFLDFKEKLSGKLLYITFDVDNDIDGKSEDVYVTINDIRNKLTQKGWKYHNGNYSFEYVISSDDDIETLDIVFSKGLYDISNIKCYVMDYSDISNARKALDEFIIDREKTTGDVIQGNINVTEDGWFHLSVPYDEGFTILVDGEETEYSHSDVDFIGFNIKKGEHQIKIIYKAPGFDMGKYVSIAGLVAFAFIFVVECTVYTRRKRI